MYDRKENMRETALQTPVWKKEREDVLQVPEQTPAETKYYELTAIFIPHPLVLLREQPGVKLSLRRKTWWKSVFSSFFFFFFAFHYPTLLLVSPSLFCLFQYLTNNSLYLPWLINFLLCLLSLSCWVVEVREQLSGHSQPRPNYYNTTTYLLRSRYEYWKQR